MTVSYTKDQGEIYPDRIDYTGNTAAGLSPTNYVKFYLESRTDVPVIFTTNYQVKTAKRLKTIEVRAGGAMVRAYRLTYVTSGSTRRSLLKTVTVFGNNTTLDASGTITAGDSLPPVTLGWDEQKTNSFYDGSEIVVQDIYSWDPSYWWYGDFNGDGKMDVCYYTSSGYRKIKLSKGDGTYDDKPPFSVPDIYSWSQSYWW